jgi:hypothetical protein
MPQTMTTVSHDPCSRVTVAILAHVAASNVSGLADAGRAISDLEENSPQMRGCAILDSSGKALAATSEKARWEEAARELLAAADAAADAPVDHAHVATGDGEAFCVREDGLAAVAVTDRFALSSLMFFDLRAALREIARGRAR